MAMPLLDIDVLIERSTIKIDGVLYELRNPPELSIFEGRVVFRLQKFMAETMAIEEPREDLEAEVERLLRRVVEIVLIAPQEIKDRLSPFHRLQIAEAFTNLDRAKTTPAPAESPVPAAQAEEAPSVEPGEAPPADPGNGAS